MRGREGIVTAALLTGLVVSLPQGAGAQTGASADWRQGKVFGGSEAAVAVRDRPYGSVVGFATAESTIRALCYVDGGRPVTGWWHPANPYWDRVEVAASGGRGYTGYGYVADVWLDTGGDITAQLKPCSSRKAG